MSRPLSKPSCCAILGVADDYQLTGVTNANILQHLSEKERNQAFKALQGKRVSLRKLSRLTCIGKEVNHRI